ncbi:hypothetical protein vBBceSLY1_00012 [Bacillus phage vB_BceS_LY1]|uniref:Uncharacterized protein n=1 Tax=Bacillus phage vB_BceS_LY1 TaxID=2950459 RepID=A0AAE9LUT3_9CAUD|nr:hypothetical protein vBBceSLY1_00012 [Bacillus phage vB_BceS_LY1]
MSNEIAVVEEKKVFCSKCGKVAIKAENVRDEEGILLAVKYVHEMIPASGYVWTCTQVMEHKPIFNTNGSMKKEMAKRPYAFKQKGGMSKPDRITPEYYMPSRDASQHSDIYGKKVDKL